MFSMFRIIFHCYVLKTYNMFIHCFHFRSRLQLSGRPRPRPQYAPPPPPGPQLAAGRPAASAWGRYHGGPRQTRYNYFLCNK